MTRTFRQIQSNFIQNNASGIVPTVIPGWKKEIPHPSLEINKKWITGIGFIALAKYVT